MRKIKLLLLMLLVFLMVVGCASLKKAVSDVTPEQQVQMQSVLATTAGPLIPTPYQSPITALAGWLACVGYNWFKVKTRAKV